MDKSRRLSRQFSLSRTCARVPCLSSATCRFFVTLGAVFSAGVLFKASLDGYSIFSHSETVSPRAVRQVEVGSSRSSHVNPASTTERGRPGLSIKKDLSIQFRDYLPRHVFVDVSLGPPSSLELFTQTYPNAHKYTLFSFLADTAYKDLYARFPNLTLYQGSVPATVQKATTKVIPVKGAQGVITANRSLPVSLVDFSTWLKDTVHPDEYVVVKMTTDPQNEEQIARQLEATGALEWIDKYYTTSSDKDVVEIAKERFSYRGGGHSVLLWDDEQRTYSDFDTVNPPGIEEEQMLEINQCGIMKNDTSFVLLLYASKMNRHARVTMDLLRKQGNKSSVKLPVTLFLPLEELDSSHSRCHDLFLLGARMELGLYLEVSSFSDIDTGEFALGHNLVRNRLVSAEHCFARGNLTLDYTLSRADMLKTQSQLAGAKDKTLPENDKMVKKIVSERKYTTIRQVRDITAIVMDSTKDALQKVLGESGKESFLVLDISSQGADMFLFQLLSSHFSTMVPMQWCAQMNQQED